MTLLSRWGVMITALFFVAFTSFFYGRSFERGKSLINAISSFQNREKINDEIFALSPFHLCLALGGMPEECADILRRVEQATLD
ncbi:hypothetical protein X471_00739 [Bartonella bacilliformis str. Heidi Mejia]|uniref:hypothetical protein n=1 Tax=Bartonella bacilliformis TaxID=774 RepID=UPI000446E720|nr:hypothetical protein [Bartonella bacilliformis]EYS91664.1 hypothetical protein X471_00739 [Bartonella bacilliformis str. Heidi Mejia]KEG17166.1 hypothetical protein H705_00216 [Bartonella bacilliformis Cond044]KEG19340.1 hypothetical protein H707_00211 [Bartonella bacilliformis Hosp800-02]KEG21455.1 hypothetical protein H704_00222 [Bartonella bacilliformis Peru38]KEG24668.1 hypothetical protein H708_00212 [Bartonella bacilliformis VAB9028]